MKAFGTLWEDPDDLAAFELRQVTFQCDDEGLDRLLAFVQGVIDARAKATPEDGNGWHRHFRDDDPQWTPDEPDLVFYFGP